MTTWQNVMVIAAHPDDEILGCGGTMARLAAQGTRVSVLLLGEGPLARIASEQGPLADRERERAFASARTAGDILGISQVITPADRGFSGFPDNRFDSLPLIELVKYIEEIGNEIRPDTVFTHHFGDLNIDHRLTHHAVLTAFRPLPGAYVKNIMAFEVPSSTEYSGSSIHSPFVPNLFVDISGTLEAKMNALHAYETEMRPFPHPRSHEGVHHLAKLRGAQSGCNAAEGFMLCRGMV
ncbi:PIG-L family deacetylase [Desulfovibrio mangrovi]|uniref:PIG-L deacetylase family protein n=1 Tax=Desulfovibrio mangrovi TaxID=2976983 RepID=UPI00224794E9|nr:PIG-L deacetylase family protein [Desulfovibrio mangrovi]UZP66802.1 PIG-L family deacetylase [Desulfovibrio mangrovi]